MGVMREDYTEVPVPPAPGFGDSIGAMTIAGGMMGALFHRERTGEATVVDVSLLGTGMWAMGQAFGLSLLLGMPWRPPPASAMRSNPLVRNYLTKDGYWLALCCLQAGKYWAPMAQSIGQPELATDERFSTHEALMANSADAQEILRNAFAERPLEEWRQALADFTGQWTVVQDTQLAAVDPQTVANGYVQECTTAAGVNFKLTAAPVQFDEVAAKPTRAPPVQRARRRDPRRARPGLGHGRRPQGSRRRRLTLADPYPPVKPQRFQENCDGRLRRVSVRRQASARGGRRHRDGRGDGRAGAGRRCRGRGHGLRRREAARREGHQGQPL